jgi:Tol biopolymer transport system component
VYFDEFKEGKWRIAQVSTRGGEVSYLDLPLIDVPFVSGIRPDGSELLIRSDLVTPADRAYWLFPIPSGPARRIPGSFADMWFLPGSDQIAYRHSSDPLHAFASDLDGGHARSLMNFPPGTTTGTFSPDGTWVRFGTSDNRLWESRPDGTGKRIILSGFHQLACCANWPPDGSLFLFASPAEGRWNLWAVHDSGWSRLFPPSRPGQLTFGPISFAYATASRDGRQIFAIGKNLHGELSVYDAQSGLLRKYLDGISAGFTDFSRDGQWVAYVTHPQGMLWRSRIDGSEKMQLTFFPMGPVFNPKWSPDGRFLAFTESDYGGARTRKIYLVSADGGTPTPLLSGDIMPSDPSWSPDGKSIVYGGEAVNESPGSRSEIRVFDLETKESKTIPASQGMWSPRWSPDGHYLAAQSEDMMQLWLYSFASGHWEQLSLPKLQKATAVGWPLWSHDSRYLYFMNGSKVYRASVPGGQPELVADATGVEIECPVFQSWGGTWFGLTPDDRVLMLADRRVEEVYALDVEYR